MNHGSGKTTDFDSKLIHKKKIIAMTKIIEGKKKFVVAYSEAAKANLKLQQSRYMRKTGVKINQQDLAGLLLETATLK